MQPKRFYTVSVTLTISSDHPLLETLPDLEDGQNVALTIENELNRALGIYTTKADIFDSWIEDEN